MQSLKTLCNIFRPVPPTRAQIAAQIVHEHQAYLLRILSWMRTNSFEYLPDIMAMDLWHSAQLAPNMRDFLHWFTAVPSHQLPAIIPLLPDEYLQEEKQQPYLPTIHNWSNLAAIAPLRPRLVKPLCAHVPPYPEAFLPLPAEALAEQLARFFSFRLYCIQSVIRDARLHRSIPYLYQWRLWSDADWAPDSSSLMHWFDNCPNSDYLDLLHVLPDVASDSEWGSVTYDLVSDLASSRPRFATALKPYLAKYGAHPTISRLLPRSQVIAALLHGTTLDPETVATQWPYIRHGLLTKVYSQPTRDLHPEDQPLVQHYYHAHTTENEREYQEEAITAAQKRTEWPVSDEARYTVT